MTVKKLTENLQKIVELALIICRIQLLTSQQIQKETYEK